MSYHININFDDDSKYASGLPRAFAVCIYQTRILYSRIAATYICICITYIYRYRYGYRYRYRYIYIYI